MRHAILAGLLSLALAAPEASASKVRRYPRGDVRLFLESGLPNALWILPTYDVTALPQSRPPAYAYAIDHPGLVVFRRALEAAYDTRIVRASNEDDVYRALDTTPDVALLIISGHGDGSSVRLGRGKDRTRRERSFIDVGDAELARHTGTLTPDAVVLLDSCFAGSRDLDGENVADAVARLTGRVTYASDTALTWPWLRVESWRPFTPRMDGLRKNDAGAWVVRDATYIARP